LQAGLQSKLRIAVLAAGAFIVLLSYAIARPTTESLFLESHGADRLPLVWIAVAVATVLVVAVYNRVTAGRHLVALMAGWALASAAAFGILLALRAAGVADLTAAIYVVKDVYIVVLIEIFWSLANTVFKLDEAKWLYGFFLLMGSVGGLVGNLGGGVLAEAIGTEATLAMVIPVLVLAAVGAVAVKRLFPGAERAARSTELDRDLTAGLRVVRRSSYLALMAALIAATQLAITLIDFEYNAILEVAYPNLDQRTKVIGQVYSAIDVLAIGFQLTTGVILRVVGVGRTLITIPMLLGVAVAAFAITPRFAAAAAAKVMSKAFDYSLFRAAKETLYIPLTYGEKTQGKAIVDIFTYRVAKGAASFMLLALATIGAGGWVLASTLALIGGWVAITVAIVRRYTERTAG